MTVPSTMTDAQLDRPSDVWAVVGDRLEAFARAWETGGPPPEPRDFLPPKEGSVRRLVLVELVKLDLENRVERGLDRPLEDYMRAFPELEAQGIPSDLIYEDFHVRRQAGRDPNPADYFRRFPARAEEFARLLGESPTRRTVSVFKGRVPGDVRPGDRVDDFDLLALLGEGQFAKVFLARQLGMQRLVALKVSAARGAEAQTLAQLDHPHIVRVYDQRPVPDRGLHLVYMPYLPGGTLRDVLEQVRSTPVAERSGKTLLAAVDVALERRGEVPPHTSPVRAAWAARSWPAAVCALGMRLAAGLDYAHRRGVLHRDVKPANVLLTAEGEPLLADFNVGSCSKLDGAGPAAFFGGTLAYMAPEHLEAFDPDHPRPPESLDGRADVYGLAVTLWELTTGERPFGPEQLRESWPGTLTDLAAGRRNGPALSAVADFPVGDVPGFRETLVRCLSGDPAERPATAGEMARELELCLRPATRALVRPTPGGWRALVVRYPLLSVFLIALVPNILASLFNIEYNQAEIIAHWPNAEEPFRQLVPIVNGIFFPLGLFLLGLWIWPAVRGLSRDRTSVRARHASLRLGARTAIMCVACWAVAGLIWPMAVRLTAGPPPEGPSAYIHFLLSLIVCGLIAAAYPYFFVTYLAVRAIYPAYLGPTGPVAEDRPILGLVERELGRYRMVAAAVPLFAVALLASRGVAQPYAVAALSVAGLVGTLLAFVLDSRTRADLRALTEG
jgi:eukaryotic-like serine/threonine-protein kinase